VAIGGLLPAQGNSGPRPRWSGPALLCDRDVSDHRCMAPAMARANSRPVAAVIGRHQLARLLEGWAAGDGALHTRLTGRLRALVRSGLLPAGTRLPSERILADALNVSRNTVGAAFDELRADGVFSSRRGDGTYVSLAGRHTLSRGDDRLRSFLPPPAFTGPGTPETRIDLRSAALPGLDLVTAEIDRLRGDDLKDLVATHGYLPAGLPELREAVAGYYTDLGLPTVGDQVVITSGAQQALRLVATALLEPGSAVLIEEPSFRGAIEVLRSAGARLIAVPSGPRGIDIAALRTAIREHRPALVVIQSTVHNPTGSVLDESGRQALASLDVPVLDDATLYDTLVDAPLAKPTAAYGSGPVLTIGSASKSFWGGLRVGWLRADPATVAALTSVKGGEDLGTSVLAQQVTARLLPSVELARERRRAVLGPARDTVLATVAELLPDWRFERPAGGASLWVRLPRPGATAFAQAAGRAGVALLPGPTFSCADGLDDHLRISFAPPLPEVLCGLGRVAAAWQAFTT
jgi:DNA-binding transcriptional MocR family regulator